MLRQLSKMRIIAGYKHFLFITGIICLQFLVGFRSQGQEVENAGVGFIGAPQNAGEKNPASETEGGKAAAEKDKDKEKAQTGQIYIKVGEAKTKKSLLALPAFNYTGSPSVKHVDVGTELFRTVSNDLTVSSFFKMIASSAFLENTAKTGVKPHPEPNGFKFESWKSIGTEFLIRGTYSIAGDNIIFEAFVYQVAQSQLILGKRYRGSKDNVRRIAHTFSNDVVEALTGSKGMFLSRFVAGSDRGGNGFREVFLMDWDGANVEKVTSHKSVSISPAWSPDGSRIAYTAFVQRAKTKTRNADLFIYEIFTGKRWLVSYRQGINSGANFDPDGKHLYLTISQSGTPDIYKMTYDGELVKRMTNGPNGALNVEPSISPDGKKLAFSSDRSGQAMIYIMNADGTNAKRITFAGKYNSTPAWSPDGKKIAFSSFLDNHFDLYVMDSDGSNMVKLSSAKKPSGKWSTNEDPSFSPDGRHIVFVSDRTGNFQIYITNLDGSEERRITNDQYNYFKPKWSKNFD